MNWWEEERAKLHRLSEDWIPRGDEPRPWKLAVIAVLAVLWALLPFLHIFR